MLTKSKYLIGELKQGKDIALVSDAGTPGISDPGFYIIREAIKNDISVTTVPGPAAFVSALVLSGLPTDRFFFEGYLPPKSGRRVNRLKELANQEGTIIIYESPHRLLKTLEDIKTVYGNINLVIAREITKKFEEILRGSAELLITHFQTHPPKGEFVVLWNLTIR